MNLDTDQWEEFLLTGEKGIFKIENCKCNNASKLLEEGEDIEYIGAKKDMNGFMRMVKYEENLVTKGNCIIFICDGQGSVGYTNYMKRDFIGSTTLSVGYNENLNEYNAMFLVTVLDLERYRYSYGRKYRTNLNTATIQLPTTNEGDPDWEFMTEYIKSLQYKPITTANKKKDNSKINSEEWKEFRVDDVLDILNGKGLTTQEVEDNPGRLPAIQSGETNLGIIGYINKEYCVEENYILTTKPCLTVARTGSSGYVAFQRNGCVVGDSAKILLLKDEGYANEYIYLFLRTILAINQYKYSYGRKLTEENYKNMIIELPVKLDGNPDWEFIESFTKSLPYGDKISTL